MTTELELGPIPENLLREPLEYIYADHFRQRAVCVKLEEMIGAPGDPLARRRAREILAFIRKDLPLHLADEEASLFPLLRLRCRPEDNIEQLLRLLQEEHAYDESLARSLAAELRHLVSRARASDWKPLKWEARAYIQTQQRHLSWENVVLLKLARQRLMPSDMDVLGREMARRRGISYPEPVLSPTGGGSTLQAATGNREHRARPSASASRHRQRKRRVLES